MPDRFGLARECSPRSIDHHATSAHIKCGGFWGTSAPRVSQHGPYSGISVSDPDPDIAGYAGESRRLFSFEVRGPDDRRPPLDLDLVIPPKRGVVRDYREDGNRPLNRGIEVRICSINSSTAGPNVRFLSVRIATGHGLDGNSIFRMWRLNLSA